MITKTDATFDELLQRMFDRAMSEDDPQAGQFAIAAAIMYVGNNVFCADGESLASHISTSIDELTETIKKGER